MEFDQLRSDTNALITAYKLILNSEKEDSIDIYLSIIEKFSQVELKEIISNLIGMVIALNDMFAIAMDIDPDKLWGNFCRATQIMEMQIGEDND